MMEDKTYVFNNYFRDQYYKRRAYIDFGWNPFEVSVKDKIENFLETEGESGVKSHPLQGSEEPEGIPGSVSWQSWLP